jgi:hypothetical protein
MSRGSPNGLGGPAGRERELAEALREIIRRLTHHPREWGEPTHSLSGLRLLVHEGFYDRLHVSYAVHESEPLVVVRKVQAMPGHPLSDAGPYPG